MGGTHTKHNPYCIDCYYLTQIQISIRTRRNILNYRTAPLLAFYAGCIYYIYKICGNQSQQKWVWVNAKSITLKVRLDRTYFAETENWKHCSKIIFKCMNSAVRPIFNEKITEKWSLWIPCTVHRTHEIDKRGWKVNNIRLLFTNSSCLSP